MAFLHIFERKISFFFIVMLKTTLLVLATAAAGRARVRGLKMGRAGGGFYKRKDRVAVFEREFAVGCDFFPPTPVYPACQINRRLMTDEKSQSISLASPSSACFGTDVLRMYRVQ